MQKIVNFTSKIVGAVNSKSIGCNIPTNSFMQALGIEDDLSFGSMSDIVTSIGEIKDAAATVGTMVKCSAVVFSDWNEFSGLMSQLIDGALGAIGSVVDEIWDAVACQIMGLANQVIGAFLSIVQAFQQLITSVLLLADAIKNFCLGLTDLANFKFELGIKQSQCRNFFASIAACLLDKFLGPYLDEFSEKVTDAINKGGNELNEALYQELQDVRVFSSYAEQQSFLMKKASMQINGLTPASIANAIG